MGLKVALAQINPTVGDFAGNAKLIVESCRQAQQAEADLVAVGEMALAGYPVEDLALRRDFQRASGDALLRLVDELASHGLSELTVVVGYLGEAAEGAHLSTNSAAVIRGGEIIARYHKHHLPNYGVFDEHRYFEPGQSACVFDVAGARVALAICEDIWQDGGTLELIAARKEQLDLLLVINGSPFETGKWQTRVDLAAKHALTFGCQVAYVNLVGGQDELVFDGASFVVDKAGSLLAAAPAFQPALLTFDANQPSSETPSLEANATESVYRALVLATRDYVRKNSFESSLLGLSGGIDSALTATIACDALGAEHVFGVSMPGPYSSEHSISDAKELAHRTKIHLRQVPIERPLESFRAAIANEQGKSLVNGVVEENLQARIRGTTLMAISNAEGHLVLATGNKSELATGYSTLYGDAVGAFAPLKDVLKTTVWQLATWRNTEKGRTSVANMMQAWGATHEIPASPIPEGSITKEPSAELRQGQLDSDSLPEYEALDAVLSAYIEGDGLAIDPQAPTNHPLNPGEIARVIEMTDRAEYKRRQYPPGPKIGSRAFGRDRRRPITNKFASAEKHTAGR
jgi:NAD+ synthase (glutamine-hydrolysing)